MVVQGRKITLADIQLIKQLIVDNPSWGRTRLSKELCLIWNWRNLKGQIKDMACRTLLLKLERAGHIIVPPSKRNTAKVLRNRPIIFIPNCTEKISGSLKTLRPLKITKISPRTQDDKLFNCLLETFVDRSRFRGICYQAANWILTGQTKGRTRNDRDHIIKAPVKDVYVYPLSKKFREALCYDS